MWKWVGGWRSSRGHRLWCSILQQTGRAWLGQAASFWGLGRGMLYWTCPPTAKATKQSSFFGLEMETTEESWKKLPSIWGFIAVADFSLFLFSSLCHYKLYKTSLLHMHLSLPNCCEEQLCLLNPQCIFCKRSLFLGGWYCNCLLKKSAHTFSHYS